MSEGNKLALLCAGLWLLSMGLAVILGAIDNHNDRVRSERGDTDA